MASLSGSASSFQSLIPPDSMEDGYPLSIFVSKPPKSCICPYCKKVIRSPYQVECGHRYCYGCINKLISESESPVCRVDDCKEPIDQEGFSRDHAARREIDQMKVYCDLKSSGCSVVVKLKELQQHQMECDFALIDCMYKNRGCSVRLERRHLPEHLKSECQYRQVTCKYCGESTTNEELQIEKHLLKCPLQRSTCPYSQYGCPVRGTGSEIEEHVNIAASDHLRLVEGSHSKLELKCVQLDRRCVELENQKRIDENKFEKQSAELEAERQKVVKLEEKVTKLQSLSEKLEVRVRDAQKIVATQNDRVMRVERDLKDKAKKDEIVECRRLTMAVQESCRKLDDRVERMENDRMTARTGSSVHTDEIAEMRKTLTQIGTQLGLHDIRLAEQDLRFQVLETSAYDGILIWKIKDYTRRKHDAVVGKTLSLYSQPFYTSRYGYKMCARVYLNGDGMGKGTHMSLFFVVMRGDYDTLLTWPFRQKVTLVLLDQDTGHRNLSDTFRPDPTSTSFKQPTSDMNIASGCPLFVSQSSLETPAYVKNDTLYIKVIVDTSDLYGP
ncbi:TNF receptor-associated factor 3-like isoform X2 [Ptychodera flava]|uniref:TNF receptor-associated factor 3-like isoform X2 n=1 Tax=Ptychodera flava TaxID=63121 RepID=UPI003969D533